MAAALGLPRAYKGSVRLLHDRDLDITHVALPSLLTGMTDVVVIAMAVAAAVVVARDPRLDLIRAVGSVVAVLTIAYPKFAFSMPAAPPRAGHLLPAIHACVSHLTKADACGPTEQHALAVHVTIVRTLHRVTLDALPAFITRALSNGMVARAVVGAVRRAIPHAAIIAEVRLPANASASVADPVVATVVVAVAGRIHTRLPCGTLDVLVGAAIL